jgi:hypothetical protein
MSSREFSFDLLDDATIEKLQEISARTGRTLEETILDAIHWAILREEFQIIATSAMIIPQPKTYLDESVYAEWEGDMLKLTSSDGVEDTNIIFLESALLQGFERYLKACHRPD